MVPFLVLEKMLLSPRHLKILSIEVKFEECLVQPASKKVSVQNLLGCIRRKGDLVI